MPRIVKCKHCGQTREHKSLGLCRRCYERELAQRKGRPKHECVRCHRIMHIQTAGMCSTCYQHRNEPYEPPETINLNDYRDYINQCRKGHHT